LTGSWDTITQTYDTATIDASYTPAWQQKIYGLTLRTDYQDWLTHLEYIHINRPGAPFKDYAYIAGIGYRHEKWVPMVTTAKYWGSAVTSHPDYVPDALEGHQSIAFTLRYDLSPSSALKVQYDSQFEQGGKNWTPMYGNSRLLSMAYDRVF
jgi:hypothetical protein